jgi:hypothetical protein
LALFGRRPVERAGLSLLPASKNQHNSGNQIGRCSPAAVDPLQHLDSANAAGLILVFASDIDEQLTVNARRSP